MHLAVKLDTIDFNLLCPAALRPMAATSPGDFLGLDDGSIRRNL